MISDIEKEDIATANEKIVDYSGLTEEQIKALK